MSESNPEPVQVSVVVTTYNHEEFIAECLESIISQKTNFKFELLVGVDDGGDNTLEICRELEKKYPKIIRVYLNDNSNVLNIAGRRLGRYNFLNVLSKVKGKYIARCDGDDYWIDNSKLQQQYDLLEKHPECTACHHWQKYAIKNKNNQYEEISAPKGGQGYFSKPIATVRNIFTNQMRIKNRTIMFRSFNEPIPDWFNKIIYGDVALSFIIGIRGSFIFIDKEMAVYRQTGAGAASIGKESEDFYFKRFTQWIQLWENADTYFNGIYRKEANQTIIEFYQTIFERYDFQLSTFFQCLSYALIKSERPFFRKIAIAFNITELYLKAKMIKLIRKK